MAKLLETLFIEHIQRWIKGHCFICNKDCDIDAYVHMECSYAYWDEKQKRLKEAWDKARIEYEKDKELNE
ncbi:MAG: hypothetical protein WCK29_01570 [archaeon]